MRRNYISPEFEYKPAQGTLNMLEESSFFGSKMIEIEDTIEIEDQSIVYFQNISGEQLDISNENKLDPVVFSIIDLKNNNHILELDKTQSSYDKENKTKWVLNINLKNILMEFIFARIKENRSFEGVLNKYTSNNNVNLSIKDYINYNILNRYKIEMVDVFILYKSLNYQTALKFQNNFSYFDPNLGIRINKMETIFNYDQSLLKIKFNQDKIGSEYNFNYYFNLKFKKL